MKKKNFTLLILLFASVVSSAQTLEWAGKFGGDGEDVVLAMHTDTDGNTYTTGYFTMDCDFDISEESYILSTDIPFKSFVQKTGPDGSFLWAKAIGGTTATMAQRLSPIMTAMYMLQAFSPKQETLIPGRAKPYLHQEGNLTFIL